MRYLFLLLLFIESAFALEPGTASAGTSVRPSSVLRKNHNKFSLEGSTQAYYAADTRGPIESASYLRAIYSPNSSLSIYVSPHYLIDLDPSAEGSKNKSELSDFELGLKKKDLANVGKHRDLEGSLRLFLPTGKEQVNAGTRGKFHARLIAKQNITTAITAGFQSRFTWYNQTRDGQLNSKGKMKANKSWVAFNFPFLSARLSKKITLMSLSGLKSLQMRSASNSKEVPFSSSWVTNFSIWSDLTNDLTFIVGVENDAQLGIKSQNNSAFAPDETKYYARVKMKM